MNKQEEKNTKLTKEENLLPNQYFDKTVRMTLSRKSEAANFINNILKIKGKDSLSQNDIENYTSAFVNRGMQNKVSDIIYKMIDEISEGKVYFLIEHQTKVDYSMPFRIIQYTGEILRLAVDSKKIGNKNYKIPIVIPIILYTGKRKWTVGKTIDRMIKWEGFKEIKVTEPIVIDVKDFTEEELLEDKGVLSKLLLLESKRKSEELEKALNKIVKIKLEEQDKELLEVYTRNILKLGLGKEKTEEIISKIRKEKREEGSTMMADVIRKTWNSGERAGIKKGMSQGIKKGQKQIVKSMLKENTDIDYISRVTGLSKKEILALQS